MILQFVSLMWMVVSFFITLGIGYEWSYAEDRSFWNKRLLRFVLALLLTGLTNVLLIDCAND